MRFFFYFLIICFSGWISFSQSKSILDTNRYYFILEDSDSLKIDSITISGNQKTKDYIIREEISFRPGSLITNQIIEFNKMRIYSLGLFTKVENILYSQSGKNIIEFRVNERWYIFPYPVFGIKYHDWSKLYYGLGLAHLNFLGRNEKIYASFALGYDPWFNFHYVNPYLFKGDNIYFDLNLDYQKIKNKSKAFKDNDIDFNEIWCSGSLALGKRYGLYKYLWITLKYNNFTVSNNLTNKTISPDGVDRYITASIGAQLNTRDLGEYPMKGEYITISLSKMGFGESEIDHTKFNADIRKYIPIISGSSLCLRTFSGLTFGSKIPYYSHYYFGYSERIRGHFSEEYEGENIWGFSSEVRIPLFEPKYYVLENFPIPEFSILRYAVCLNLFYDAGLTWNRYDFVIKNIISGFGFGINLLLPYSVILRCEAGFNEKLKGEFIFDAGVSF